MQTHNDALEVILTAAGIEWTCPACRMTHLGGDEAIYPNCGCGGRGTEKRVSSYHWSCPECGQESYEPREHGGAVRCRNCRAQFAVGGTVDTPSVKKKKTSGKPKPENIPFLPEDMDEQEETKGAAKAQVTPHVEQSKKKFPAHKAEQHHKPEAAGQMGLGF